MGLPTEAKEELVKKYVGAFSFTRPTAPTVYIYDLMQNLKAVPDTILTMGALIDYLVGKIKYLLFSSERNIQTIIVLVDKTPPPVKVMVEHAVRYKDKDVYSAEGGPYLPQEADGLIPMPWIRFAGNYRLLQRELYPRLFSAFMALVPKPGQSIILHGFPGFSEYVTVYQSKAYASGTNDRGQVKQVHMWDPSELPITPSMEESDKDLYNRVYLVENVPPSASWPTGLMRREEWVEARNEIAESDGAMFFYDHWFQRENIMFCCNDGDVFAYGLLYAYERLEGNVFRNCHYVCLPYKKTKDNEFFGGEVPAYQYVDLNLLYILIGQDPVMRAAGVQNHIATTVFLLIMAGSDFFANFMKGLGTHTIVWTTFFNCLDAFTHMVQLSKGITPHTRTPRTIVLDEELFRLFVHYCYVAKYGKAARKRLKIKDDSVPVSIEELKIQCSLGKRAAEDPEYRFPDHNKIRLWARQVEWNMLYFKNTPFGNEHSPNPFQILGGLPYYPYVRREDGTPTMTTVVSAHSKPVDEVYMQHKYKRKRERAEARNDGEEATQRKKKIIKSFQ